MIEERRIETWAGIVCLLHSWELIHAKPPESHSGEEHS